jgi:hypothetical protein
LRPKGLAMVKRSWGTGIRRAAALVVLLGAACGTRVTAGQNTAAMPSRIEPKAQEVLDRLIQAMGGPAFLKVKRLTTRGRTFSIRNEATAGYAPFESYVEYPDKRRFSYGKNPPVILINNGDQAWELDRYGKTDQLEEQVRRWQVANRFSLENLLRLRIHEPGILIQSGGVDFVDNVATQAVDIVDSQGTQVKLDLNRRTLLPVRVTCRVQDPKSGEWDEFADVYGEYKVVDGVTTPMHIARFINDERVSEVFRAYAHYDDDYPATYFQPVR